MPGYKSPGVYVEEIPSGSPPISGVSTSTAAIIGEVANSTTMPDLPDGSGNKYIKAPINDPRLVTNWTQFINQFGNIQNGNDILAHAVSGFLQNGGSRCYVVRTEDMDSATLIEESLKRLEVIDEIAIVCAPGALDEVATKVIDHCVKMEDRFAIIDGHNYDPVPTPPTVDDIKGTLSNSTYAALYYPWFDISGETKKVPPSGHVAGVYAHVDMKRGVHKSPANENVRGLKGLDHQISKNMQDDLNKDGINVIRNINGSIKIWGARTLGGDANGNFKYINVRRLFNFIRESFDEGMQFAVFEPNAQPLWKTIQRSATAFLTNIWRDGALFGDTPEKAFYVKCDEPTNDEATCALGQVVTEIGLAMVKPAEFVIFRISQTTVG